MLGLFRLFSKIAPWENLAFCENENFSKKLPYRWILKGLARRHEKKGSRI
jgi:hypothetical protein